MSNIVEMIGKKESIPNMYFLFIKTSRLLHFQRENEGA
jgi:hypothetical protein